jgi:hypothetical protein
MPVVVALRPASHIFEVSADHRFEVEHVRRTELDAHLKAADPNVSVWCFRCERSFRLGAVRAGDAGVSCGYADCTGGPLDFWSWDAYRAFVGAAPEAPESARRYPLAA